MELEMRKSDFGDDERKVYQCEMERMQLQKSRWE